jgi:hypothetical protein
VRLPYMPPIMSNVQIALDSLSNLVSAGSEKVYFVEYKL